MEITGSLTSLKLGDTQSNSGPESLSDSSFAALLGGDTPQEMLHKITKDGIQSMWAWQIDQLREKVASEIMKEKNLTAESISKMDAKQRASVEDEIMKEVERRIKQLIADDMEKKKKGLADIVNTPPTSSNAVAGSFLDLAV